MLKPSEAVRVAKSTIREIDPEEKFEDLRLEEIELSPDSKLWLVTLGFHRPRKVEVRNAPSVLVWPEGKEIEHRVYKRLKIDASTGEFRGLEMR